MSTQLEKVSARTVPTQFVEAGGRTLAYRRFGEGPPLVMCLRFRGVMDDWDPAFLDALAANFEVITFDYSGIGLSTGMPSYVREKMAGDARDLVEALGLDRVVILGWSIGGTAAQIFTAMAPERTTHAILIASVPPGPQPFQAEPVFLPTATKAVNSLEDEYILFFEPDSAASRAAADASHARIASRIADRSPLVPEPIFMKMLQESYDPDAIFPDRGGVYSDFLAAGSVPILAINGDHDVVLPVENWYRLGRKWKSLYLLTIPDSGHGPQHQEPQLAADAIASFVRTR